MTEIKDRIQKIMQENELSPSRFADVIGVPRSGLSHVLKGRNKASLDYVLKILEAFPQIDATWLISGKKTMLTTVAPVNKDLIENPVKTENKELGQADLFLSEPSVVQQEEQAKYAVSNSDIEAKQSAKHLEKIVFFYSDGSFKEYNR